MNEELNQKYSNEVCKACESMTYGKRNFTLPQKYRLSADFYQNSKDKKLVGPIADASAEGYDAVLVRRSHNPESTTIKYAQILVKMKNGEIEEKQISFDFCSLQNFPGNHLVIIESKTGVGIYEDTNKNEKEPVSKEYAKKIEKVGIYKFIHQMAQILLFGVDFVFVTYASICVNNQRWYIKLFVLQLP